MADPQVVLFRRQYLQLFEPQFLAWPPKQLLRDAGVQKWIYSNLFDSSKISMLPPVRYQVRVLKILLSKIEKSIENPEEDEISDDLMSHFSELMANELPSEMDAAQRRTYVTFSCIPEGQDDGDVASEQTITLLERPHLISGALTTGFRTWEAALHLSTYLLSSQASDIIKGKNVLELGAGTGFVSLLCAKHLEANHMVITDGDEGVVDALTENLFLNGLDDDKRMITSVLRWGQGLRGTWVEEDFEEFPYDVILGADITYDKLACSALAATLRFLFDMKPTLKALISGTIRNVDTFESFRHACLRNNFTVEEIDFEAKPIHQQRSLFYAKAVPIKILSITRPEQAS